MAPSSTQLLRQLAHLYGIQPAYYDATRRRQYATQTSLLAALRVLGSPVATRDDVPAALRQRLQAVWQRGVEPVVVAWDGVPAHLDLRVPAARATGSLVCHLQLEAGGEQRWEARLDTLPVLQTAEVEGLTYVTKRFPIPVPLPWGYHHSTLEAAGQCFETLLIVAPRQAYTPPEVANMRTWGVFLPLYALHTQRSWGSGDFTDLEALATWLAELGGGVVATLPMLSAFLDEPCEPSPYAPASRLFWNELYIDVSRAPGIAECTQAQALLASTAVQETLTGMRTAGRVDYRRQMALKRQVLEALAQHFFATQAAQHPRFQHYMAMHPAAADYARFRAMGERQRTPWWHWPALPRDGTIGDGDYDPAAQQYHLYVQWVAHTQLHAVAERSKQAGVQFYLDLPLGVHGQSYDVWRERNIFALEAAGGAPPDTVFTKGQNWGFPPLHPEAIRTQHYRYCIAYLQHQLRHTGLLRIDHVMGLHRLFWVPKGYEARHGVYVQYAAEELYAILSLESHRHQVRLVGENLGTVPAYVNTAMARHRLRQMYVLQYELTPPAPQALRAVPARVVASLNTHDMAPFAAYCQGLDIADLQSQGLVSARHARQQQRQRQHLLLALQAFLQRQGWLPETPTPEVSAVLRACLGWLSASPAEVVLVNLEDLWLETQPQNFPGTHEERPNWQGKARYSLDTLRTMPAIVTLLQELHDLRQSHSLRA